MVDRQDVDGMKLKASSFVYGKKPIQMWWDGRAYKSKNANKQTTINKQTHNTSYLAKERNKERREGRKN
eukprot:scaffold127679_cov41-Prasinocladus_malaysianus.AAC.1